MDVCGMERMPEHILRYMERTSSNNNNKVLIIIRCVVCNSGCIHSDYDDMRYTVYRWGFSCLDYSFYILILLSHNLGCTSGFAMFAFIGFNSNFQFYYYYIIYSWFYHLSTTLLVSCCYHIVYNLSLTWHYTLLLYLISWLTYSWSYTDFLVTV